MQPKEIDWNKLCNEAHQNAVKHGFWENKPSDEHFLCLVISELMEAVEADRKGKRSYRKEVYNRHIQENHEKYGDDCAGNDLCTFKALIKDTVEDELADAVIRLLDLSGSANLEVIVIHPIGKADLSRMSFTMAMYSITAELTKPNNTVSLQTKIGKALGKILSIAEAMNIDLLWHIEQKMIYNESREKMHGKSY